MSDSNETYRLVSGEVIEYATPPPAVADYLARVQLAAQDPSVSLAELIDLIYSEDNPIMATGIIPGRGVVTQETFDDPVYRVMMDQVTIKRVQLGQFDPEEAKRHFTMTVGEAAERLLMSEPAVRKAIHDDRLAGRKIDGRWFIDPASVKAYDVDQRRGPKSKWLGSEYALDVCMGSVEGLSCRIKKPGPLEDSHKEDGLRYGTIEGWRRICVIIGGSDYGDREDRKGYRLYELAPAEDYVNIEEGPFYVRGKARLVDDGENAKLHTREALEKYKAFQAE